MWKPAHQACQQQPGHVHRRLMPRAMHTIPLWGTVQGDQDGKGSWSCRERQFDELRHDNPRMAPAIGRRAVRRPHPTTMPSLAKLPMGFRHHNTKKEGLSVDSPSLDLRSFVSYLLAVARFLSDKPLNL